MNMPRWLELVLVFIFVIIGAVGYLYCQVLDENYALKTNTHRCLIQADARTQIETECTIIPEVKTND